MIEFGVLSSSQFSGVVGEDAVMHFLCLGVFELTNGLEGGEAAIVCIGLKLWLGLASDDVIVIVGSHVLIVLRLLSIASKIPRNTTGTYRSISLIP